MRSSRFTEEQTVAILQEHAAGAQTGELIRRHGISRETFCKWRRKSGGLKVVQTDQPTINYDENQDMTPVTLGQWHLMEFLLDTRNSTVKWWMDGKLKGSYSGVHYAGAFRQAEITPIWGGIGGTKTENDFFWFDHVHIGKP